MEPSEVLKYFAHGIAFSFLYLLLSYFWVFLFAALIDIGLIIGFIIGVALFFLILAGINVYLSSRLWDISVRDDWKSLLEHGFILFIALILVSIPIILLSPYIAGLSDFESLTVRIIIFIGYAFLDGFLAKNLGELWEEESK